ncbi:hypothetical protein HK102_007302 [Quaeritorhiza haematococci]|nr:hypothetical protein HK102_007302 [Quaeritorhiza haematococci]
MKRPGAPGGIKGRSNTIVKLLKSKTVGFFAGVCLLVNAMTGPAVPFTAANFQSSGWLPPLLFFAFFTVISSLSALFIVEAMQAIPGNKHFQGTVEFGTLINFYFGSVAHILGQICLYGALMANAVQSIIISSQTLDNVLIDAFGRTCGLALSGPSPGWYCVDRAMRADTASPFGSTFMLFTIGFLLVLILCIPMGIMNLDDNVGLQVAAFIISNLIFIQWVIASILSGFKPPDEQGPLVPVTGPDVANLVGTVMLSMAFTFVVPSWVNLKKRNVNVQATLWTSTGFTMGLYILIGLFPALAFRIDESAGGNVLPALTSRGIPTTLTKVTGYMFSLVMLLPSIPVSFVVAKNNLLQNELMGRRVATIVCYILPWVYSIPFQTGSSLGAFIAWTSLLFVSTTNFIIPLAIYLKCLVFRRDYNSNRTLSDKQKRLLKSIHQASKTIHDFIDSGGSSYIPSPLRRRRPISSLSPSPSRTETKRIPPESDMATGDGAGDGGQLRTSRTTTKKKGVTIVVPGEKEDPVDRASGAQGDAGDTAGTSDVGDNVDAAEETMDQIDINEASTSQGDGGSQSQPQSSTSQPQPATDHEEIEEDYLYDPDLHPDDEEDHPEESEDEEEEFRSRVFTLRRGTVHRFTSRKNTATSDASSRLARYSTGGDDQGLSDDDGGVTSNPTSTSASDVEMGVMGANGGNGARRRRMNRSVSEMYLLEDVPDPEAEFEKQMYIERRRTSRKERDVETGSVTGRMLGEWGEALKRGITRMLPSTMGRSSMERPGRGGTLLPSRSGSLGGSSANVSGVISAAGGVGGAVGAPSELSSIGNHNVEDASGRPSTSSTIARVIGMRDNQAIDEDPGYGDMYRKHTLPTHPAFISPAFRSIPRWVPVRPKTIALVCLAFTCLITVGNLVLLLVQAAMGKS